MPNSVVLLEGICVATVFHIFPFGKAVSCGERVLAFVHAVGSVSICACWKQPHADRDPWKGPAPLLCLPCHSALFAQMRLPHNTPVRHVGGFPALVGKKRQQSRQEADPMAHSSYNPRGEC